MVHYKLRYDIAEACKLIGISRAYGYRRIRCGALRVQKDGDRSFITAAELDRYVRDGGPPPNQPIVQDSAVA